MRSRCLDALLVKWGRHLLAWSCAVLLTQSAMCRGQEGILEKVLESVRNQERMLFEDVQSFSIEVERTSVVQLLPTNKALPKREGIFRHQRHGKIWRIERQWTNRPSSESDPEGNTQLRVCEMGLVFDWDGSKPAANIYAMDDGWNGVFASVVYLPMIGVDVYRDFCNDMGMDYSAIRSSALFKNTCDYSPITGKVSDFLDEYQVAPETEMVGEAECLVVERSGYDKLWVDASDERLIRKRQLTWGPDQPLRYEFIYEGFDRIDGQHFPDRFTVREFGHPDGDKEMLNKVEFESTYVLRSLELDSPSKDQIRSVSMPPGARI